MVVAPFIALAFRVEAGLAVMSVALVATAILLRDALGVAPGTRRWVRVAIAIDIALAAACVGLMITLLARQ
jgi:hypothetical protein